MTDKESEREMQVRQYLEECVDTIVGPGPYTDRATDLQVLSMYRIAKALEALKLRLTYIESTIQSVADSIDGIEV